MTLITVTPIDPQKRTGNGSLSEYKGALTIPIATSGPPISDADRDRATRFLGMIGPIYRVLPPDARREIVARLMWMHVEQVGSTEEDVPRILGDLLSAALEWRLGTPGVRKLVVEQVEAIRAAKAAGEPHTQR